MLLKTRESKTISANLITSLLDHLTQFLIIGKVFGNVKCNIKLSKLKKLIKRFYETAFVKDGREVDRSIVTQTETETEFKNILFMMKTCSLGKLQENKQQKPCVTKAVKKSIKKYQNSRTNFIQKTL